MTDYITEDELTEAMNILCDFAKDQLIHHIPDLHGNSIKIQNAVKYLDKAMADEELVMVYYP